MILEQNNNLQMMQFQLQMQKELLDFTLSDPDISDADKAAAKRQYMELLKSNSDRINLYLPTATSNSGRPPLPGKNFTSPRTLSIADAVDLPPPSRLRLPSPSSARRSTTAGSIRSNTPTSQLSAGSRDADK